jgi:hypothetical protein
MENAEAPAARRACALERLVTQRLVSREDRFRDDVAAALRAWTRSPSLPVVSILIWAGPVLLPSTGAMAVSGLLLLLITAGWAGTERVWYAQCFQGIRLSPADIASYTWGYVWRYVRLGFLLLLPFGIAIAVTSHASNLTRVLVITIPVILIDFGLTFVTPALALSTYRVREALPVGIRMIRAEWPRSAWYVFLPPLAIFAAAHATRAFVGPVPVFAASAVAALVASICRGATVAFYLRHGPVPDDEPGPMAAGFSA